MGYGILLELHNRYKFRFRRVLSGKCHYQKRIQVIENMWTEDASIIEKLTVLVYNYTSKVLMKLWTQFVAMELQWVGG